MIGGTGYRVYIIHYDLNKRIYTYTCTVGPGYDYNLMIKNSGKSRHSAENDDNDKQKQN